LQVKNKVFLKKPCSYFQKNHFEYPQDLLFFRGYRWAGLKKKGKKTENRKTTLEIVREDQDT
jgi:hypothetical protein